MEFLLYNTGQKAIQENLDPEIRVYNFPVLDIEIISPDNSDDIKKCLTEKPVIVFQSKNGVAGFSRWLEKQPGLSFNPTAIYSTGDQTAAMVQKLLMKRSIVPEDQNAKGLIQTILKDHNSGNVLLVTGILHRKDVLEGLTNSGFNVTHTKVYNTLPTVNWELKSKFQNSIDEIVFFTSPSSVEGFLLSIGFSDLAEVRSKLVSIGPTTTNWVMERAGSVYLESPIPDISVAMTAILAKLQKITQA